MAIMIAFVNWQVSPFNCLYRGNLVLPLPYQKIPPFSLFMLHFEIHWPNTGYTCIAIMNIQIGFVNWQVSPFNCLYRGNLVLPLPYQKIPPPFSLFMLHFEIHWPNTGYTCIVIMNAFVNWQVSSFNCLYRGNLVLPLPYQQNHPHLFPFLCFTLKYIDLILVTHK